MRSLTLDANVIIKWIFPEAKENHTSHALSILKGVKVAHINVLQPPHWLAEVTAVVVRLQPKIADVTVDLLSAMEFDTIDAPEIYHLACQLSHDFNHHLVDTLYHAVAIYKGHTQFVTADDRYYRKAQKKGSIMRLEDFSAYDD